MTSVQETRAATAGIAAGPLAVIGGALLLAMGASQAQAGICAVDGADPVLDTWGMMTPGSYNVGPSDTFDNLCYVSIDPFAAASIDGTLNNYSDVYNEAFLVNSGTLDNKGSGLSPVFFNGRPLPSPPVLPDGVFINDLSGFIANDFGTIENGGEFYNQGIIDNNSGSLNNDNLFENSGQLFNFDGGGIENTDRFINKGFVANDFGSTFDNRNGAVLTNESGAEIAQLAGTLTNRVGATFNNAGVFRSEIAGGLVNDGAINNSGTFTIDVGTSVTGGGTYTQTGGALTVNGTMTQASLAFNGGTIGGNGAITGDVTVSNGVIAPGNTPGVTSFAGDLSLLSGNRLEYELGGTAVGNGTTGYDQIDVTGMAIIGADTVFDIEYYGGFTAVAGNAFDLLVAGSIDFVGSLANFILPVTSGLSWVTSIEDVDGSRQALRLTAMLTPVAPPPSPVPLPASLPLLMVGVLAMAGLRRSRRAAV